MKKLTEQEKEIRKQERKLYHAEWYNKHKEEQKQKVNTEERKQRDRVRYLNNKDNILRYKREKYQENPEMMRKRKLDWDKNNPEKLKQIWKKYSSTHRKELQFKARKRELLTYTPKWISKEELQAIKIFYKNCPDNMVIDHIIPLRGKTITGFHVLANLQYLSPEENRRKSNKFPYYDLEFYRQKGVLQWHSQIFFQ